jgi:hypothetical protein
METSTHVSVKELRDNLKEALRKSGALNSVKAHIRKEFISGLSQSGRPKSVDNSLKSQLQYSIVYHHLKSAGLNHTLSVYVAESGHDTSKVLPERDILSTLKVGNTFSIHSDSAVRFADGEKCRDSVLGSVMVAVSTAFRNTSECSVQTDNAGPGVRELLDNQIRDLQTSYLTQRESERLMPSKTIEERMIAYQRECEERMRRDLQSQVGHSCPDGRKARGCATLMLMQSFLNNILIECICGVVW